MQLEKTIALRLTNEDQEILKQMAWDKRMRFGSYCRYILVNHIKDNKNDTSL